MNGSGAEGSPFALRRALPGDAASAADLHIAARQASVPAIPPLVHPADDVHRWFRDVVMPEQEVWLAEERGEPVAVMVLSKDDLEQLYVHPDQQGRGVGSHLVRLAQSLRPDGLHLWTFESNLGAQRFYQRHGFIAVEHTDGSGNDERAPDVRYAWQPQPRD